MSFFDFKLDSYFLTHAKYENFKNISFPIPIPAPLHH